MKKNKFMHGRKGGISTILLDFWAYIAFVLVVAMFYAVFTIRADNLMENKLIGLQDEAKNRMHLSTYLRTTYSLDGSEVAMAEMIAKYYSENDADKKQEMRSEILQNTKNFFDQMEYCKKIEDTQNKAVVGYALYILDEATYENQIKINQEYQGSLIKRDKKFQSEHFYDGQIKESYFGVIPSAALGEVVYLGFFVSSLNTIGIDTSKVRGCR